MSIQAKGTIKIADANGKLTAFYPKTDSASVDMPNGISLQSEMQSLQTRAEDAAGKGSFKVYRTEPTKENTSLESARTFIGFTPRDNDFPSLLAQMSFVTKASPLSSFSNKGIYAAGDEIDISCYLRSNGSADIENIHIENSLSGIDYSLASLPADAFESSERTVFGSISVSVEDVLEAYSNGRTSIDSEIECTFDGAGETAFIDEKSVLSYSIPIVCDNLPDLYLPSLTTSVDSFKPSTQTHYSSNTKPDLGFEILVHCLVKNVTAMPVRDLTIEVPECGFRIQFSLEANGSEEFTANYAVTEEDLLRHRTGEPWEANVHITGTSEFGTPIDIVRKASIQLAKPVAELEVHFLSDDERNAAIVNVGDSISYYGTVLNTGNLTLQNVMMPTDASGSQLENIGDLLPGETRIFAQGSSFSPETEDVYVLLSKRAEADVPENAVPLKVDGYPLRVYSVDYWQITVDTSLNSVDNTAAAVPFCLYPNKQSSSNATLCVEWGDGKSSYYEPADFNSYTSTSYLIHNYESQGRYAIKIACSNWDRLRFATYGSAGTSFTGSHVQFLRHFRLSLVSIDRPLPDIYGTYAYSYYTYYTPTETQDSLKFAFRSCSHLESLPDRLIKTGRTTDLSNCFTDCALSALPEGLLEGMQNVTQMNDCFANTYIPSVPSGFLDDCSAVENFQECFYGCSQLESIPEGLFKGKSAATSFNSCFYGCSSLQEIPSDTFEGCTAASNFSECFRGCSSIQSIPSILFSDCINAQMFDACFYSCRSLELVPSGLFASNAIAEDFSSCFSGCTSLHTVQAGTFGASSNAYDFSYCFYQCSSLDGLPASLFPANASGTSQNFSYCFYSCTSLQSISGDIFALNSSADTFEYCFAYCSSLEAIPSGLFSRNSAASKFYDCFYECTSLQTIPDGLFENALTPGLGACFYGCTSLQTLSSGVLRGCSGTTQIWSCFRNCTSLQTIPPELFRDCTSVTSFERVFSGCTSLQSVPAGLFDANTAATSFIYCFSECTSLRSVPPSLFAANVNATNLSYCFYGCSSLLNYHLIIGSTSVSNCSSFSTMNLAVPVDRIICIPNDSCTTYTKFNSIKSSLKATLCTKNIYCLSDGYFEYTINTEAETEGAVLGSVPIHPVSTDAGESSKFYIDWGDGTGAELNPSDFPNALEHTYEAAGTYTITAGASDWSNYEYEASPSAGGTFKDTLVSVDERLPRFANASLDNLFCGCTHLSSIERRIFWNLQDAESLSAAFKGCASLTSIPASLLKFNAELQNADSMFEGSGVEAVPSGLLSQCRKLQSVNSMFKDCANLAYVSEAMLLNCPDIVDSADMFSGCPIDGIQMKSRAELEAEGSMVWLFDTEATSEGQAYIGIPFNLYGRANAAMDIDWGDGYSSTLNSDTDSYSTATSSRRTMLSPGLYFLKMHSNNWEAVPISIVRLDSLSGYSTTINIYYFRKTLIEVCTAFPKMNANEVYYYYEYSSNNMSYGGSYTFGLRIFRYCQKLRSIPPRLFSANPAASQFGSCFYGCASLQAIPEDIFEGNTGAVYFDSCFYQCTAIRSIPSGLFASCVNATSFSYCFYQCTSLDSIEGEIFGATAPSVSFNYCFSGCTSLRNIPSKLFSTFESGSFDYCFYNCRTLASLPSDLFSANASSMYYCFQNCISLQSIPSGLFDKCTDVTTFYCCFYGCTALESIPEDLFISNVNVKSFGSCFQFCTSLSDFKLYIGSKQATSAGNFVSLNNEISRIVLVPEGSVTYSTFAGLDSNLGLTVIPYAASFIPEDESSIVKTDEDLIYIGDSVSSGRSLTVIGKSVLMHGVSVDSSAMIIGASEGDIRLADVSTTGNINAVPAPSLNDAFRLICNESVFIKRCVFEQAGYNCLQFGLQLDASNGLTSNAPKFILIDGCTFGDFRNNPINFYTLAPDAVVTISNCSFGTVSNAIRISNNTNVHFTLNLVNCTFEELDDQEAWRGIIVCQDYTSATAEEFAANSRFGPSKITINVTDCYDPSGSRIESPSDMSQLLGSGSCANPLLYVYADHAGGLVPYDASLYPSVSILNT